MDLSNHRLHDNPFVAEINRALRINRNTGNVAAYPNIRRPPLTTPPTLFGIFPQYLSYLPERGAATACLFLVHVVHVNKPVVGSVILDTAG